MALGRSFHRSSNSEVMGRVTTDNDALMEVALRRMRRPREVMDAKTAAERCGYEDLSLAPEKRSRRSFTLEANGERTPVRLPAPPRAVASVKRGAAVLRRPNITALMSCARRRRTR